MEVAKDDDPSDAIVAMIDQARDFAASADLDAQLIGRLSVIVEELVSNIVRHGNYDHSVTIELALRRAGPALEISIRDDSAPFDPTQANDFAGPDPVSGGGVGLELVRRMASKYDYVRENDRNCVRLVLE